MAGTGCVSTVQWVLLQMSCESGLRFRVEIRSLTCVLAAYLVHQVVLSHSDPLESSQGFRFFRKICLDPS